MSTDPTRAHRLILVAAVAGFALRLAFGIGYWQQRPLTHDERETSPWRRASPLARDSVRTFAGGDCHCAAVRQGAGYPLFLALIGAGRGDFEATPTRVKIAQSIVGAAGVWLIGWLAARAAGSRAGVAAAVVAAVYPPLVWICSYVFSEALYSTMALATVVLLNLAIDRAEVDRSSNPVIAIVAGVVAGLSIRSARPCCSFCRSLSCGC